MEQIGQSVQKWGQQITNSPTYLSDTSPQISRSNEVSIYKGDLTLKTVAKVTKKLKDLFPSTPATFFDVFMERLKDHNFTDQRLIDAANHVIDTHHYPTLMISDFIGYDKTVKLHTHSEMSQIVFELQSTSTKEFVRIQKDGKNFWLRIADYEKNKSFFETLLPVK